MTTSTFTMNATIPVGGTYNSSSFMLGNILSNNTQEIIPLLTDSQINNVVFDTTKTGFKVYNITDKTLLSWTGNGWFEVNDAIASVLVSNGSSGQTTIDIADTDPPEIGQVLTAVSSTKAIWATPSGSGGTVYNASFVQLYGNGFSTDITVIHNLNTESVLLGIWEIVGTEQVAVDCTSTIMSVNSILLHFHTAPATNSIKVIVVSSTSTVIGSSGDSTLPDQTGEDGKYLYTNGTVASWESPLPALPGVSRYLYTDGSTVSWSTITALINPMTTAGDVIVGGISGATGRLGVGSVGQSLTVTSTTTLGWTTLIPDITSQSGKFLTNNGTITSWINISQVPAISSGVTNYILSNNGTISQWIVNTAPPNVSGQAGKFLTNNGTITNWTSITPLPSIDGTTVGKFLTNDGSSYSWGSTLSNPLTTSGDIIVGGSSGVANRLGIGSVGQILTVYNSTTLQWQTPSIINPLTTYGDLVIGGNSGVFTKLAAGIPGQVLTVYDTGLGHYSLEWASAFTNPMTTTGDIVYGSSGGGPTRLGIGASGTVLTSVSGLPQWTTILPPVSGGTSGEFLTNNGSTVSWGTVTNPFPTMSGGTNGQYLTNNGSTASWATLPSGFANPMTTTGDMISANSGGAAGRLPIGTSGQILTVVSGGPSWQTLTLPTGLPSQTGSNGYYLTTNGTTASWYQLTQLVPAVSGGTTGQFLGNNGTTFSWTTLPNQLPTLTGQSGKYLTTDGSTTFWNPVSTIPSVTGQSGKILSTDGVSVYWVSESSVASLGTLPFTFTSSSLAVNSQEIDTASTACYAFQLMTISVSGPCRVRFYGTSATATGDLSRLSSTAPVGNVGLFAEFVFDSTHLSWICTPAVFCFNNDTVINQNIYITIQNTGSSTAAITVTATILKME